MILQIGDWVLERGRANKCTRWQDSREAITSARCQSTSPAQQLRQPRPAVTHRHSATAARHRPRTRSCLQLEITENFIMSQHRRRRWTMLHQLKRLRRTTGDR
ncbi:MAG: hypothetical protein LKM38_20290 [Pseudomonas veronii]|jgi:EAL domain-containing protein (putative c-di-GMP-specific phosphodiesterase class I)|nr:hypothetical protein [Pseudomonas veronii]